MIDIKSLVNWVTALVLQFGFVGIWGLPCIIKTRRWLIAYSDHRYVALKVYVNSSARHRELPIYDRINQTQSNHSGRKCVRMLLDSFEISGPHGRHHCLVHEPLGMSLYDLQMRARNRVFSKDVLRTSTRQLLAALDFLHTQAGIIHTGNRWCILSLCLKWLREAQTYNQAIFSWELMTSQS